MMVQRHIRDPKNCHLLVVVIVMYGNNVTDYVIDGNCCRW